MLLCLSAMVSDKRSFMRTYLNMALLEKMGDLRHASRAAHGSLYNGPGI
jgi:hypothetical protein